MHKDKAQSLLEYVVLLGLVTAIFYTMNVYLRRGIQAGIKISADQLGNQEELSFTNPREDSIQVGISWTPEPTQVYKTVHTDAGGATKVDMAEVYTYNGAYISEGMDDGLFYYFQEYFDNGEEGLESVDE